MQQRSKAIHMQNLQLLALNQRWELLNLQSRWQPTRRNRMDATENTKQEENKLGFLYLS